MRRFPCKPDRRCFANLWLATQTSATLPLSPSPVHQTLAAKWMNTQSEGLTPLRHTQQRVRLQVLLFSRIVTDPDQSAHLNALFGKALADSLQGFVLANQQTCAGCFDCYLQRIPSL
jgi:hypothetical protein